MATLKYKDEGEWKNVQYSVRKKSVDNFNEERAVATFDDKIVYEQYIKVNTPTTANTDVKVVNLTAVTIIELSMIIKRNDGIQIPVFNCSENDDEAYLFFNNNGIHMHVGTTELNATAIIKVRYTKT